MNIMVPGNSEALLSVPFYFNSIQIDGDEKETVISKNDFGKTFKSVILKPGIYSILVT